MGCGPPKGGVALDLRLALLVHGAVMPFWGQRLCPGLLGGPFVITLAVVSGGAAATQWPC